MVKLLASLFHSETPLKSNEAKKILEDPKKTQEVLTKLHALKEGRADSAEIEIDGKKYILTVNETYSINQDRRGAPSINAGRILEENNG